MAQKKALAEIKLSKPPFLFLHNASQLLPPRFGQNKLMNEQLLIVKLSKQY